MGAAGRRVGAGGTVDAAVVEWLLVFAAVASVGKTTGSSKSLSRTDIAPSKVWMLRRRNFGIECSSRPVWTAFCEVALMHDRRGWRAGLGCRCLLKSCDVRGMAVF